MNSKSTKTGFLFAIFLLSIIGFFPLHTDATLWAKLILCSTLLLLIILVYAQSNSDTPDAYRGFRNFGLLFLITLIPALIQADSSLEGLTTFSKFGFLVISCMGFIVVLDRSENWIQHASKVLTLTLFLISGWAFIQWIQGLDGLILTHQATYAITANMQHRNLLIQYMMVLLPFTAFIKPNGMVWNALRICASFMSIFLCILLLNRMAWITLLVYGVLTIFVQFRFKVFEPKRWKRISRFVILALAIILLFGFFVIDEVYTFWHQLEMSFDLNEGTTLDRILLQSRTLQLGLSSWLFGSGFDTWKVLIMQFSQDGMLTESGNFFYQRPHNDYLWLFSEAGFVPALLYLGVHLGGIRQSFRRIQNEGLPAFVLFLAWIGIVLASLTNFPLERAEYLLIIALLCVLTFQIPSIFTQPRLSHGSHLPELILASAIVVIFAWRGIAEMYYFEARQQQEQQKWTQARSSIRRASQLGLVKDAFSMPLDWFDGYYSHSGTACHLYQKAYAVNPYHPDVLNSLGICSVNEGNLDDGMAYFYESVSRTPRYLQGWFNIAQIWFDRGNWRNSFRAYLNADPTNSSEAFDELGVKLAVDSLNQMLPSFPERKMFLTVKAIRNTPHWALELMKKSSVNNIPFSDQVLIDACYYMHSTCAEYDDCDLANSLIEKYLPAGVTDLDELIKIEE